MSYVKRFCPTCGVSQPSVDRRCTLCGSPVRLVSLQAVKREQATHANTWRTMIRGDERVSAA